jgi:tight adherence protein B
MSPQLMLIAGAFLATLLLAGTVGLVAVRVGGGAQRKRRLGRAAGKAGFTPAAGTSASLRRDEVTGRLAGLELLLRRVLPGRQKLRARLARTGLNIPLGTYFAISLMVGLAAVLALSLVLGTAKWPFAVAGGLVAAWLLPRLVVGFIAGRRLKTFLNELPDAIDVMVRGLKSGLPVTETIATVANDFDGPVGEEFQLISDHVRLGSNLEDALWDVAGRLDVAEFNFLAISIGLQRETGGNLTETLANLSSLLRRRQQMRLKIKAISSEARASAYILGLLPFAVGGTIAVMNPDYASALFVTETGNILLGVGLASEAIGVLVMAKMVRIDI